MARRRSRVQIRNLDRLRARMEALGPQVIEAARAAVQASAEAVRDDTRAGVRVKTGNLRDTVVIAYQAGGLRATIGWRNRKDWYASIHEHGTQRIPAQPALGPALEMERTKFEARLRAEVRKIL
ncbi:HK97-gp10 family putative phage morphogenesis protein [Streptomyces albipurpureus]|uniref:HK97 gp10 family phage protein n=1 Tax=Streptomyces albipurpureus TaxID=2897419 RepID=A0ABT0UPC9_9ACTN|nr:HK97-gp10 family putative phage morphogenesis protein [Streptomyces sp. CWNU-1]MCM2390196.1 hypothetical protein [Streptomyces sp. CWNU-1]